MRGRQVAGVVFALFLTGCIPIATLRTPEVVQGRQFTLGGSLIASRDAGGALVLPYAAYAFGDGNVEYNFSVQMGLRAGIKWAVEPGLSLDVGGTLPPLIVAEGLPLAGDIGLLIGLDPFYLSPRLHGIAFQSNNTTLRSLGALVYQLSLGYRGESFLTEVGLMGGFGGGALLSFSAGARF
ncbi:hypothetical protein Mlute_00731 [Meiothermus luteus]|uniref:Lipoprotein n=1 Tax=Meiothermus luteus TaxID=2026184 RepID=A0A399EWY1_9DEIN|nr:hypothetical protein [Meiothermus luteus]RIH88160.1 hypothetical protein Mlute_00731 [Meiothermus luteus]RMH54998.1 MAG: hypothetical protein D6684_08340 [Deinococcota bacterium]